MMAASTVITKRKIESKTKVKTGCKTCRIRKIKCDEGKPLCKKCVGTGRICDGYETPFRTFTSHPINDDLTGVMKLSSSIGLRLSNRSDFIEITPRNISLLSRYFSTKTLFDVKLDCDEEAGQVMQAGLNFPPIRHAVLSLKTLREDLEISGDDPASTEQDTSSYHYGLQQYGMALRGLASNLSSMGSNDMKPILLCCQILISIEQVRKNYSAMAQHIIRGLMIMHENRARPVLVATNIVPAHKDKLPLLDVFVIKLFAAPCKFADPPPTAEVRETISSKCPISLLQQTVLSHDLRTIVPNNRKELVQISLLTLAFLDKVSRVKSLEMALQMISEKAALLDSLESWLVNLDSIQFNSGSSGLEPISVSFLRMFHLILRIVLLGALESSPDLYGKLQTENDRLQSFASNLGERVRDYVTCSGRQERLTIR